MRIPLSPGVGAARARVPLLTLLVAALIGCGDGPRTIPPAPRLLVEAGDGQRGRPGERLVQPIVVELLDPAGAPLANAEVRWSVSGGGSIDPTSSVTDERGRASAAWTLGGAVGVQRGRASIGDSFGVDFTATTDDESEPPLGEIRTLALTTYDGSGQTVHPDFIRFPAAGAAVFGELAITPYPNGNSTRENPSIFEGSSPLRWSVPSGVTNPVVKPTDGYLSDPDLVYDPDRGELRLYYREVSSANVIRLTTSRDGIVWGASATVVSGPNHTIVSPAVVRRGAGDWLMWAVDANSGCAASTTVLQLRRSTDGIAWSAPQPVELSQPGVYPWHIDVQWIPNRNEYWAIFNGKTAGSCTTPAVYLATSGDGVRWTTYPTPLLMRGATPDFEDVVYRTTFAYDPVTDVITFWYSGAKYDGATYVWKTAVQRQSREDVFAGITRRAALLADALGTRPGVPPLLEAP